MNDYKPDCSILWVTVQIWRFGYSGLGQLGMDARNEKRNSIAAGRAIEAEPLDDTATQAGTRSPPSDEKQAIRRPDPNPAM